MRKDKKRKKKNYRSFIINEKEKRSKRNDFYNNK